MLDKTLDLCNEIIDLLDEEYAVLKNARLDELANLNERKEKLVYDLQIALTETVKNYQTLSPHLSDKIDAVQKASMRNSNSLKAMMDASRVLVGAIQEAHSIHETGGTYGQTGYAHSNGASLFNRNLGSA